MQFATAPASSSPSCGPPMKNIMLMPVMRPRSRSGVSSWRMMLRRTVLTVSVAPTSARQVKVSQKERENPNTTVATPWPITDQTMAGPRRADVFGCRNQGQARDERSDCRSREQPAVAARADMEDVLREDRQQRRGRREERRKEVEQHRRADERRPEHEPHALRAPRRATGRSCCPPPMRGRSGWRASAATRGSRTRTRAH